jgi:hypothetical protein
MHAPTKTKNQLEMQEPCDCDWVQLGWLRGMIVVLATRVSWVRQVAS